MATILVGDWADFLGVKRNAVSRAVLMSALPQAHKTLGSKSLTWDYAQYDAFVADAGGIENAARKIMDAARDYCTKKRTDGGYVRRSGPKKEKPPKANYKPVYDDLRTFLCSSCNIEHNKSELADNGRGRPICKAVHARILARHKQNSEINKKFLKTYQVQITA